MSAPDLLAQHADLIEASGIAPGIAAQRGYRSITAPADAAALGFNPAQAARVPALLVPVFGPDGVTGLYQLRPDHPRTDKKGKPIKYETPAGSRMAFDVPPYLRQHVGNPNVPLLITEGVRKGDAVATHAGGFLVDVVARALCVIALLGVWNWRGTNEHGASVALGAWEYVALKGRLVYIAFDSDVMTKREVQQALDRLAVFLTSKGAMVKLVYLPPAPDGGKQGVDDFLAAGGTLDTLLALAADTSIDDAATDARAMVAGEWTLTAPARPDSLAPEAFYGLAGDFVRIVAPHTEADDAALLVQILVAAGCLIGHGPFVPVDGGRHYANLYGCLVGDSAKARKGTSWGRTHDVCERVDPLWTGNRIIDGIGSGQALIECVRDGIRDPTTGMESGGEPDKRTLVQAPEFAALLAAQKIESSTLSAVLRNGWDSGRLQARKRGDVLTATGAHIAVVAHITRQELLKVMSDTESMNGYANRFLWVAVSRSKELPFGGDLDPAALNGVVTGLRAAIECARMVGAVGWTEEARILWRGVYHDLSEAKPGMAGAVTARGEAQVVRLALVYALLNGKQELDVPHLRAALAVWRYCEASARWIFGDRVGDAMADTMLTALREAEAEGMTRTELSGLFGRHANAGRLGAALGTLTDAKLARCERTRTTGRPSERWYATVAQAKEAKKGERTPDDGDGENLFRINSLLSPAHDEYPPGDEGVPPTGERTQMVPNFIQEMPGAADD